MMYVILGIGIFIGAIGFILTENNAKYLLSGYNTMTQKEREKFDIRCYVPWFRKFHIFLGISLSLIGMPLAYIYGSDVAGAFLTIYPLLAYTYFIIESRKYIRK
jgi:hypothetical protein